jgi:hypothetical protein
MARRGRLSKAGKRHPNGRRVHEPTYDKGSEWVQERRAKYQTHYSSALGRAYAAGLLADDAEVALDRYQAGKRFARVYNRIFGGETYRCALDRSPRGGHSEASDADRLEYEARDQEWLFSAMASLDSAGCRPYLDQLLAARHTDVGPDWLDRLLAGGKDTRDQMLLKAAINALDIVSPPRKEIGIRVERWDDAA